MRAIGLLLLWACQGAASPEAPDDTSAGDPTASTVATTSAPPTADTAPTGWRSVLFPAAWTPDHTLDDGRFLHDHSYAGYHAGERPLPAERPTPVVSVLDHGADPTGTTDSAEAFDAALAALPDGGTLHVPGGTYVIGHRVDVTVPGTVVAGDGPDATFLHVTEARVRAGAGLRFVGQGPPSDDAWALVVDGAARSHTVEVADPTGLAVGDAVTVGWTITPDFVADHGMTGTWTVFLDQHKPFFRRTITALDGTTVTLDVPLRYDALVRDGAQLRRDARYLSEVGLEDLAISSVVDPDDALAVDRHHAIELDRVQDAWVRRVRSWAPRGDDLHLQSGGIYVQRSRRVTVSEVAMGPAQHRGGGGNGYLFEISRSNEILTVDSEARGGRHNFIQNWDFGTSGCVWLRTLSRDGRADNGIIELTGFSEFHHSLAMANLIDASVVDDGWQSVNRQSYSSGAGHAGTHNTFWNLTGAGTLRSWQVGWGYVVGTGPDLTVITDPDTLDLLRGNVGTWPEDHVEGLGEAATLDPPSLYEAQLTRRLANP